ncbi:MAG: Bifunctional protein GlmU [Verrucomicrobia subdivision 3 bacterium]|nr:Bifunctional protein GlmU [Limisphaerales bacterium]MCS1417333.1 Bifunctional protein GlmU [Limisphaerales bacterium]
MLDISDFFDLKETDHAALFDDIRYVWEGLKAIKAYVDGHLSPSRQHSVRGRAFVDENVSISEGTIVEDGAVILGPSIIGKYCQIRHNAYVRPYSIIGNECVVGNSSEIKHSLLFNRCQVPHFNYVGDSILGFRARLGAGVKISNLKLTPGTVVVDQMDEAGRPIDSGLRKFGAMMGDRAAVGCNAVLNPGSILEPGSIIYPNVNWRGILPRQMIAKNRATVEVVQGRPRAS